MTKARLTPYEAEILEALQDFRFPLHYSGAACNQALEVLRTSGYINEQHELTTKGKEYLDA